MMPAPERRDAVAPPETRESEMTMPCTGQPIRLGVIGAGLMRREFAAASEAAGGSVRKTGFARQRPGLSVRRMARLGNGGRTPAERFGP
jgi:hypothetical protein